MYENTYEQIVRRLRIKDVLDEYWVSGDAIPESSHQIQVETEMFEYKWTRDTDEVFGPYTLDTIQGKTTLLSLYIDTG